MAMQLRTPLRRVRGLGAAHEGTGHFWRQRLTSVAAVPLTLVMLAGCLAIAGMDYEDVRGVLALPVVAILLLLLIVVYVVHMRIGMEEIIVDYVRAPGPRIAAVILNTFFAAAVGLTCVFAILKLALGA